MANSEFRVCCSPWAATDGGSNSWTASGTNILTAPSREDPEEGRTGQSDAFALTFQPSTPNTRELDAQPRLTMPPTARSLPRRSGRATRLLVTRLDRLARSTRDLLNTLDALTKAGAKFKSLADAWADTTTPHGRLIINTLSGLGRPPVGTMKPRTRRFIRAVITTGRRGPCSPPSACCPEAALRAPNGLG